MAEAAVEPSLVASKNTRNAKTNDDNDPSDGNDDDMDKTANFDFDEFHSNNSAFETTDSFAVSQAYERSKKKKSLFSNQEAKNPYFRINFKDDLLPLTENPENPGEEHFSEEGEPPYFLYPNNLNTIVAKPSGNMAKLRCPAGGKSPPHNNSTS